MDARRFGALLRLVLGCVLTAAAAVGQAADGVVKLGAVMPVTGKALPA